jgi:cytosine/adenosine deaminase-related metal-dependent hydrolase
MDWQLTNATLVTPNGPQIASGILVSGGIIESIMEPGKSEKDLPIINLHGLPVYPGLINSHDTLMATYHAYTGKNVPYLNWLAYDNELKSSELFRERMMLDLHELYLLGAYKNILSGVTTVVDHIPEFVRLPYQDILPISLLEDYAIAHSVCSYSLGWGEGLKKEIARAKNEGIPFITHIAEGFDPESKASLKKLDEESGLDDHTVLVHGISLNSSDLTLIAEKGSHLVWCPTANLNIYKTSMPIHDVIDQGINLCIGTDSSMTGSTDIFAELRKARDYYFSVYGEKLGSEDLFHMVTTNASKAYQLDDRGFIMEGLRADLMVLEGPYPESPYDCLVEAKPEDIYLLTHRGQPIYGNIMLQSFFDMTGTEYEQISVNGKPKLIYKGIRSLLDSLKMRNLTDKNFDFLPVL